MSSLLINKRAIVTGGGSGIGKAIAETFAEHGAFVFVLDLNLQNAEESVFAIQKNGGRARAFACNVAEEAEVADVFKSIVNEEKEINILVNSAGIAHVGNIENSTAQDLDRLYAVNVKGCFLCMKYFIELAKDNGGVILNIASIAATVGIPDRFAYSMTKGAVLSMTYSVARDYIDKKIRCNSISPARIHTPFVDGFLKKNYPGKEKEMFQKLEASQPIGRMGQPKEVANLAKYLCSDEASFITGTDYPIDGGFIRLK